MEQQIKLSTQDIAEAVRMYTKLPNAMVRFVADISGGEGKLEISAVVTHVTIPVGEPKQLHTVVVESK